MFKKFSLAAAYVLTASGVFAETNVEKLKAMQDPDDVLIYVENGDIPKSPRVVKGLYDEEKYGDWLLDVSNLGEIVFDGTPYIADPNMIHIYTYDKKNRGFLLTLSCRSALIANSGTNYSVLATVESNITARNGIEDSSKYLYILDYSEGEMQESLRHSDEMISLGVTSSEVVKMINLLKSGSEISGMLDVDSRKQVFQFSLKGFTKAYDEMRDRCLKFSYVTYNRVFR
jgi:hypothetical protein